MGIYNYAATMPDVKRFVKLILANQKA